MFDFNKDPGEGNLNLRAYMASLVGPRRVAHGKSRVIQLQPSRSAKLQNNGSRANECMFIECQLPVQVTAPVNVIFSYQQDAVGESGILVGLSPGLIKFQAVLLPNEELYAQLAQVAGAPAPGRVPLVVTTVTF